MSKRLVALLIIAAVLLTAFSFALSRRDSRDWRANRSRRLFPFPWQDITAIDIAKPDGRSLAFERSPKGEWLIRLDDELLDTLSYRTVDEFAALSTLTWREPMPEGKPPQRDEAVILTATSVAGQKVELAFGEASNNLRAVVVDGDESVVYGVNQDLLKFFDWPDRRFRNLYLAAAGSGRRPRKIVLSPKSADQPLRIALERRDEGWRMTDPVDWPVDESRLDLLFRWLERLQADSIEAEMSADLEWFGLGPEAGFVEVEYDGPAGDAKRRVEFGKAAEDDRIYARVAGRNPVFALAKETLGEISFDSAADYPRLWCNFYRRRALNAVGDEAPAILTVERLLPEPVKLTLEQTRDRDGVKWRGTLEQKGATRTFAVDPPDPAEPLRPLSALLTGLSSLRVKTFLADAAPGPETIKWTAYPAWRFTGRSQDGAAAPALTLYAADADGNLPPGEPFVEGGSGPREMVPRPGMPDKVGIAFSLADRPAVMETFADLAYLLCLPPYRYQSRRVLDHDPRDWVRVVIETPAGESVYTRKPGETNEQWWRGGDSPEPLMDDNNLFVTLLLELSQLRAEGFVLDADTVPGEFELDRPEITAIVYVFKNEGASDKGDEALFKLDIGSEADAAGKLRYARLDGSGPVFLISGRLSDALGGEYR